MAVARTPRKKSVSKNNVIRMPATMAALRDEEIAGRAYEIFLTRGAEHGRDLDDWLQAEREIAERPVQPAVFQDSARR